MDQSFLSVYHNPDCGTSRNTLAMIRQSGEEPEVIQYHKTPPSRATVVRLIGDAGLTVRAALRAKDTPYDALGLKRRATPRRRVARCDRSAPRFRSTARCGDAEGDAVVPAVGGGV